MPVCLRSQPSCHVSLIFAGYSNLLNGDILKMSNLKLSQPGVQIQYMFGKIKKKNSCKYYWKISVCFLPIRANLLTSIYIQVILSNYVGPLERYK